MTYFNAIDKGFCYNRGMGSMTGNVNQLLSETRRHLQTLLQKMPDLITCVVPDKEGDPRETLEILEQIPDHIIEIDNRPVISVAFCGPSGAGKSTVFNLLTSLGVPAGGAVRPMTHASLAAFPEQIKAQIDPQAIFPEFELSELVEAAELKKSGTASNRLFFRFFNSTHLTQNMWPCLVDIPDFNTTEIANWDKAEEMIRRAESIIFTVYHEAYKDQKTFDILKKVLKIAGNVTWLLTKLDPQDCATSAAAIRDDLIASVRLNPEFADRRTDGLALADFLEKAAFFYSPFTSKPSLEDIKPLANCAGSFMQHIYGQNGLEVALKRQLQSIMVGVAGCENICHEAETMHQKLFAEITACDQMLEKAAQIITGEEFPVFRILELIRKQLEANRPSFLRRAFQPLMLLGSTLKAAISSAAAAVSRLSGNEFKSSVKQRDSLERGRLNAEVNALVDFWRRKPELEKITTERCTAATEAILTAELPPIDSEWETSVNESLQKWQAGNKDLWKWMNIIDDLFILLGTGLVVADFFIDGGIGTMGVVAAVGGSSAAGGFLMSLFNNMGLGREVMEAHHNWKKLRRQSYRRHLRALLAGPIFLNRLEEKAARLAPDNTSSCREACAQLKEISRIHEH